MFRAAEAVSAQSTAAMCFGWEYFRPRFVDRESQPAQSLERLVSQSGKPGWFRGIPAAGWLAWSLQ